MTRFRVNSPTVLGETIDGEVVILNLDSGHYFNTIGSGALIWGGVERQAPVEAIEASLAARYGIAAERAREVVEGFLGELQAHSLIRECDEAELAGPGEAPGSEAWPEREEFAPPVLGVHSDMKDLLLLDPIHQVDEVGWPVPANAIRDPSG